MPILTNSWKKWSTKKSLARLSLKLNHRLKTCTFGHFLKRTQGNLNDFLKNYSFHGSIISKSIISELLSNTANNNDGIDPNDIQTSIVLLMFCYRKEFRTFVLFVGKHVQKHLIHFPFKSYELSLGKLTEKQTFLFRML